MGVVIGGRNDFVFNLGISLFVISPFFIWIQNSVSFSNIILPFFLITLGILFVNHLEFRVDHVFAILLWVEGVISTISSGRALSTTIITYFLFIFLYILITSQNFSTNQIRFFLGIYINISVIVTFIIILSAIFGKTYLGMNMPRYSLDIIGIEKNPNYINAFVCGPYVILLYKLLLTLGEKKKNNLFVLFKTIIILTGSILTGTRAALLVFGIVTVMVIIHIFNNVYKIRKIKVLSFLIAFSLILFLLLHFFIPHAVFTRFNLEDNTRTFLWSTGYNSFHDSNIILGFGLGGTTVAIRGSYLHSMILQHTFDQGIIGFILFLILIFVNTKKIEMNDTVIIVIFSIALFYPFFFNNGNITVSFWYPIIWRRLMINYCSQEKYSNFSMMKNIIIVSQGI